MTIIHCICGKANRISSDGRMVTCACGATVRITHTRIPVVRIEENSLQERKAAGKPVIIGGAWAKP